MQKEVEESERHIFKGEEKRCGSDPGKTEAAAGQSETGVLTSEATQQGIYCCFYDDKSTLISL